MWKLQIMCALPCPSPLQLEQTPLISKHPNPSKTHFTGDTPTETEVQGFVGFERQHTAGIAKAQRGCKGELAGFAGLYACI